MARSARLHFVIKSATSRHEETAHHISVCSQLLADECGFDGFTMNDLAESAGVSRRTLFNYFPGKADAVLGAHPGVPVDLVEEFRSGGPHQNLVQDLGVLVHTVLAAKEIDRDEMTRYRRLLKNNPKLVAVAQERLKVISEQIVAEILEREGPTFGTQRARVAAAVLLALLDTSLDSFVEDNIDRQLADVFMDNLNTAHELLS